MSSVGEDAATGTVWERLCAVGIVLCKLFSGDKSTLSFEDGSMLTHDECINSSKEDENEHVVKRTSRRVSMQLSLEGPPTALPGLSQKDSLNQYGPL